MRYPNLRCAVLARLAEVFGSIKSADVHRSVMWMLGEFSCSVEEITRVMVEIRAALGEVSVHSHSIPTVLRSCVVQLPIVDSELRKAAGEEAEDDGEKKNQTLFNTFLCSICRGI